MKQDLNPVLVREMRQRFRGARAFVVLTLMLIALAAVGGMAAASGDSGGMGMGLSYGAGAGSAVVLAVMTVQSMMLWLIAPALTATSVSGEIEKGTWELLLATPLSGRRIIAGKLGAAMAYVSLLLFAGLPVLSLGVILGGVSTLWLTTMWLGALTTGLAGAMLGLFFSTVARSSARALVASYVSVVLLSILRSCGTTGGMVLVGMSFYQGLGNATTGFSPTRILIYLSLINIAFNLLISSVLFLFTASKVRPRIDVLLRPATVGSLAHPRRA